MALMYEYKSYTSPEGNQQHVEDKLFGPVPYTDGIVSLERLNPVLHGKPTPLDPESVYVIGSPQQGGLDYRAYAELEIMDRLGVATESLNMQNDLHLSVASELERRLEVMVARNQTSYNRLLKVIEAEDNVDDSMLDIINRARQSDASVGELAMLLNAYPDMISVEFYKFTNPFNNESIAQAIHCIEQDVISIDHTVEQRHADYDATLYEDPSFISQDINDATIEGIKVHIVKHKIGDIQFDKNNIEIITKQVSVEDRDGTKYQIGVSSYLRASDYPARLQQIEDSPTLLKRELSQRQKKLSNLAIDMDMLSQAIQPQLEASGVSLEDYLAKVKQALDADD
ncbi:MAG: hypothetical protein L0H36_00310 [bacterium]|nr:hypothetical protein [bacterium]MDN5835060.1 hypothetical protein [bacterium]